MSEKTTVSSDQPSVSIAISDATIELLRNQGNVRVPEYTRNRGREKLSIGWVIFGTSNFARSMLLDFAELAVENRHYCWGASVISTRKDDVVKSLGKQNHMFVAVAKSKERTTAVLNGVIREALFAPKQPEAVMSRLINPQTKIVALTVSKDGYYLPKEIGLIASDFALPRSQWLDFANSEISHDLIHPNSPTTVIGYLTEALRIRKARGIEPFTIISCDNVPRSGQVAKNVVLAFAEELAFNAHSAIDDSEIDPELAEWIRHNVDFCDTMVDRITPKGRLEEARSWLDKEKEVLALHPVTCEEYKAWYISNNIRGGLPVGWAEAGVEFKPVEEVNRWGQAKKILLNGSHLIIGISGTLLGFDEVHTALDEPVIYSLLVGYMNEALPTLEPPEDFDPQDYIESILDRFDNPALPDKLSRVARNRYDKVTKLLFETAERQLRTGSVSEHLVKVITLWIFSMTDSNIDRFDKFEEGGVSKEVRETCQSIWNQGAAGECHLMSRSLQIRDTFPQTLKHSEDFASDLCSSIGLLAALTNDMGVEDGTKVFLQPLH